ncbi:helix-turn-helix domain-containing protein [Streptomyces sp. NRRL F-5630]|uniref:helix-turn-helix domain-containing protein n=1 Tax=Streptomyces sp. NRRL F-5630 TaxID=1463864 RepID=UPI003D723790
MQEIAPVDDRLSTPTGIRIKRLRQERHLTQKALADLAGLSYSTITKTEKALIPLTPHVTACIARALRVDVAAITGQPYYTELRQDELDVLIRPIREALDVYDLGADPDVHPRPYEQLDSEAEELLGLVRAGEIKRVAGRVAALVQEVTTLAHRTGSTEGWSLLARTYRTAYDVSSKLGFGDLAALSLARMDWAAQRASCAVVSSMHRYMRALTYLREGQYRTGERLMRLGLDTLEQAEPGRERDVVTGQLHLGSAVMAGRARDAEAAGAHLDEAERIAHGTGEATRVHWLSFGPTNVAVHRVSVAAELDDYGRAARDGVRITFPADWPASRRSHHYAELARAQVWTGDLSGAFTHLLAARKAAPQQARYHATVRETYAALEAAKRQLPDSFLSYGSWLGA